MYIILIMYDKPPASGILSSTPTDAQVLFITIMQYVDTIHHVVNDFPTYTADFNSLSCNSLLEYLRRELIQRTLEVTELFKK